MADDYLGRKMEEYRARQAAGPRPQRPAATLRRLLLRNRSYRGYDPHFLVRRDQLLRIIEVNTLLPSAMNRRVLWYPRRGKYPAGLYLPGGRLCGPGAGPSGRHCLCDRTAKISGKQNYSHCTPEICAQHYSAGQDGRGQTLFQFRRAGFRVQSRSPSGQRRAGQTKITS